MNEDAENVLAEVIVSAAQSASRTGQFLEQEIPLIAEEVLRWAVLHNVLMGVLFLVPLTVTCFVLLYVWRSRCPSFFDKQANKSLDTGFDEGEKFLMFFCALVSLVFVPIATIYFSEAMQAVVAPRAYLLEYAAHFVGGR